LSLCSPCPISDGVVVIGSYKEDSGPNLTIESDELDISSL
jgi:hypothetical protein